MEKDKIFGGIFGLIVSDALGLSIQFVPIKKMKFSKLFLITFSLLCLLIGTALAQETSWSYPNSELAKHNLYSHFLQGHMKANLLGDAKKACKEVEISSLKGSILAFKFIPDVSAIELSYLLYSFSSHKSAIKDGCQPYWLKQSDLQMNNIKRLSKNIRLNRHPGIITLGLLKIAEEILHNSTYLDSGKAQQDIQHLFKEKLWCRQNHYSPNSISKFIEQLENGKINITSVIDELAKKCKKSNIN